VRCIQLSGGNPCASISTDEEGYFVEAHGVTCVDLRGLAALDPA
jgi:hypothetical protein